MMRLVSGRSWRAYLAVAIAVVMALVWPFTVLAAKQPDLTVIPGEGRWGSDIEVKGTDFTPGEFVDLYFSRDKVVVDSSTSVAKSIDSQVTCYQRVVRRADVSDEDASLPGEFHASFEVPYTLDGGATVEDVHNGQYYIYATYRASKVIVAAVGFTVLGGEITLAPETAQVAAEVTVTGEKLRPNQAITINYDGEKITPKNATRTDSQGRFSCVFVVPERPAGQHIVLARDESGDTAEAELKLVPQITVSPTTQGIDQPVAVSGTGFAAEKQIIIQFETEAMPTLPPFLNSTRLGSLGGSFNIPPNPRFVDGGVARVTASDEEGNTASAELSVLPMPASVRLSPETSLTEPGYVGMELEVAGIWFTPSAVINIVCDGSDTVATAQASESRYFSTSFIIPPGAPGEHTVTASDGAKSVSAVFTVERARPAVPLLLLPAAAERLETAPHFDWEDVSDPSGVSYTLQVALDSNFETLTLEKTGLTASEYTVGEAEMFRFPKRADPYYWRVKAVDGTATESDWSLAASFYVTRASSSSLGTGWLKYLWIALGVGLAVGLTLRWRSRRTA
jgi:hypothetical protein